MSDAPNSEPGVPGSPAEGGLASASGSAESKKPRRRFFPRFSLRSLTLCVLLAASGLGLWWKWEPWIEQWSSGTQLAHGTLKGFLPDGRSILTTAFTKPSLWNASTGEKRVDLDASNQGITLGWTEVSLDGRYVFRSHLLSRSVSVWEAEDGRYVTQLDPRPSERVLGIVRDQAVLVTVQPDGDNKVDGRMRCVDLKTKEETFARSGTEFCLDRNGMAVACKTKELAIEIYRLPRGELVGKVGSSMPRGTMAAFDVDAARLLYIAGESDELTVYDTDTGSVVSKINTGWLERIELSPNASVLLLHSFNEAKTTAFGVATGLRLWSTDDSQTRYHRFSFSPDSRALVVTEFEGDANNPKWSRIVESRTGCVLAELAPADGHYVNAIYSPTEMRILAEEADGTLTMWERRRPEQWWGVAWLAEFWLTVVFALLLGWSLVRDFKTLRKKVAGS